MNNNETYPSFGIGDVVIGNPDPTKSVYSTTGRKLDSAGVTIYGDNKSIQKRQKEIIESVTRNGGKLIKEATTKKMPSKTKKPFNKKIKTTSTENDNFVENFKYHETFEAEEMQMPELTVQFENDFGKIKAKVIDLIDHEQAYMLVFKNDDAMVFEPKVGESLKFHTPNQKNIDVYYPGVTFNWPENGKKSMILFKVPSIEQE